MATARAPDAAWGLTLMRTVSCVALTNVTLWIVTWPPKLAVAPFWKFEPVTCTVSC
jgi:hypothetical protein